MDGHLSAHGSKDDECPMVIPHEDFILPQAPTAQHSPPNIASVTRGPPLTPAFPAAAVLAPSKVEASFVPPTENFYSVSPVEALRRNSAPSTSQSKDFLGVASADYFSHTPSSSPPAIESRTPKASRESSTPSDHNGKHSTTDVELSVAGRVWSDRTLLAQSLPQATNTPVPALPHYPDQALSSVHTRPTLRSPGSPYNNGVNSKSQSSFFPLGPSPRLAPRSDRLGWRTTRTAGNTPAHTPGLFPFGFANQPLTLEGSGERAPLPSPYLHPVQVPPPRTTRSAQRDIDFMSGRKMINRYEIISELGRGVHGKVKLARNLETGELVAIKIVQRYSKRRRLGKANIPEDKVKKEIAILKKVQHPNIVRLIEVIDDPDISKVYIVLEYCEQRELVWRTGGQAHIVLMEYYTQEKDTNALSEDASNANITEIQRIASRRKARQAQKRLEMIQAAQSRGFPDLWSLEYAMDSGDDSADEEIDTEDGGAIVSSQLGGRARKFTEGEAINSPALVSGAVDAVDHAAAARPLEEKDAVAQNSGYSFYSTEWYPEPGIAPSLAQLDEDARRRRQTSVAESLNSQLTERMDSDVPMEFRYVPTMTIDECRVAIRDALIGLEYLHYNGIIHRDIKPENLLRTRDNRIKISDFGVSYLGKPIRDEDDSEDTSEAESGDLEDEAAFAKTVGTPAFYAPEICRLDLDSDAPVVKAQVDIWALGITLYCLLFARVPFDAENEFALMRRIRDEDIFIPTQRLRAVDPSAPVRSPGHGPLFQKLRRNPHDFLHETINEDLRDLLRRFFCKDPTKRITIREIKHHPWILQDLQDFQTPSSWIDYTDPSRVDHGKKIEISQQELQEAVMPIDSILGRIRSISKRATNALGLSSRRRRGQSSTASSEAGSASPIPEQSIQERGLVHSAPRPLREKEIEHPLSRSVTATPDPEQHSEQFDEESISPTSLLNDSKLEVLSKAQSRPTMPDRHASELSTTGSIRTVRPSDFDRGRRNSRSPPSPEVPEFSLASDAAGASDTIITGAGPNILHANHSMGRLKFNPSSASPPRTSVAFPEVESFHTDKMALRNNTPAPGYTDFPIDLKERLYAITSPEETGDSTRQIPLSALSHVSDSLSGQVSRHQVATTSLDSSLETPLDRSVGRGADAANQFLNTQIFPSRSTRSAETSNLAYRAGVQHEPTEEEYRQAKAGLARRRHLQDIQDQEHEQASRPSSSLGPQLCPPSPDDEAFPTATARLPGHASAKGYFRRDHPFHPASALSSEDPSGSDVSRSRSTSFPSCPSAVSADSSIGSDAERIEESKDDSANSSDGTAGTRTHIPTSPLPRVASASDDGYHGDGDGDVVEKGRSSFAVESDDDESEDDEEVFLTMSRKKHDKQRGQIARTRERRETALAERKASRSGSSNTMKKDLRR